MTCLLFSTDKINSKSLTRKNKFVPPEGKILLIIGQDINTIDAYVSSIGILPGGFMAYTSIQEMDGIYSPVDYGAGTQHFQYLTDRYPNAVIQIGLYMVGALEGIIKGLYDKNIDKLGKWIKKAKRPIYLRIGYEFDGPHNHYEPNKYIKAYRYIVDRLRMNNVDNVAYIWHSYAGYISRPIMDWYPGDEYVDWFAISYFHHKTKYMDSMVQLALEHNKPLMIAESTPCGIGTHYANYAWERWFQPFFNFIIEKNVKAICYINSNWEEQPMWKGQGWKDARIQANKSIKKRWLEEIKKERYLQASPELYKTLDYHFRNYKE
jgi:hypothetical protein